MKVMYADPTVCSAGYTPRNSELFTSFADTYYQPPKRARKVSDPRAAVAFLYSTIEKAGRYYSPLITILTKPTSYVGTKIAYRDVVAVRNQLVEDGVLELIRQGGWAPTGGITSVYRLNEQLYRRLVWNSTVCSDQLGTAILRTPWSKLTQEEKDAYISDHISDPQHSPKKNKKGEISDSAWATHYSRSTTRINGTELTDPALTAPLFEINSFSTKQVWELADGPLVMYLEKDSAGNYVEGPATRRGYAGDFIYTRIFTDDTSSHGRFYCHAQNLPKVARQRLVVNGEQTVELDFKALHPSIFLQMNGHEVPEDIYMELVNWNRGALLQGVETTDEETAKARQRFKLVVNVGINAPTEQSAVRALSDAHGAHGDRLFADRDTVCAYYNAAASHPLVGPMLGKGLGLGLMNIDSNVMQSVMLQCSYENIPFLAVHDSVVVPVSRKQDVLAIMRAAYTEFVGVAPKAITEKLGEEPVPHEVLSVENWTNPYYVLPGYQTDCVID